MGCYQRVDEATILGGEQSLPLGVTGNTPDSGSGESWFEPRRGNSKRDATMSRVALCTLRPRRSSLAAGFYLLSPPFRGRHFSLVAITSFNSASLVCCYRGSQMWACLHPHAS